MEAGRELDALVAERVMGYTVRRGPGANYDGMLLPWEVWDRDGKSWNPIKYSADIAAAWQVIEKLADRDPMIAIWGYEDGTAGWFCDFEGIKDHARTAPHAICLAALKAVGVDLRQAEHTNETGNEVVNGEQ